MPRNQGTSRKGKPGKNERAVGLGKALKRSQQQNSSSSSYRPRPDGRSRGGDGGMAMQRGVASIGVAGADGEGTATAATSVLELRDIDDFLQQADLANREFVSERQGMVVLDETAQAYRGPSSVRWSDRPNPGVGDFAFRELSVPRRPEWDETTTPKELDRRERETFLDWRRGIAAKEEEIMKQGGSASVTPFEKNIEVWRQLWRVLERSSCLLQLADARNPLFYLSDDLRDYARSLGKPMMVLVNKSDYLSARQRRVWYDYLVSEGWDHPVFFSAVQEQEKLDAAAQEQRKSEREEAASKPSLLADDDDDDDEGNDGGEGLKHEDEEVDEPVDPNNEDSGDGGEPNHQKEERRQQHPAAPSEDGIGIDVPLTRDQLVETMLDFARKHSCEPNPRFDNRIQFGMVGFPNVGKSSVINVLVGSSKHAHGVVRVGVASQPGKTKHFQTLLLPDNDEIMLCDCPGLVFPSFVSNTADLIAAGVYPIAQMRDHWPVVGLICQRIPREIINALYGIQLPTPSEQELRERGLPVDGRLPPPTAEEFLSTFCVARGMLAASSGVPDYTRAARSVIKDYATGRLLYCHPPPKSPAADTGCDGELSLSQQEFFNETIATALHNTKKLRDKLNILALTQEEPDQDEDGGDDGDNIDDDLLELLGGSPSVDASSSSAGTGKKNQNGKKKHKWGKKDRKNRNKDPYGCHSSPDEMLHEGKESSGLRVSAGKYSRSGYTRPTNYAGVKSAH